MYIIYSFQKKFLKEKLQIVQLFFFFFLLTKYQLLLS